jgi:enoyl-CoA hydratase/carnithine racemase
VLQKQQQGRVLRLTRDRPEKRNALNIELSRALVESIRDAARDSSIGAIVLAGNGKSFCAGMDLQQIAAGATEETNLIHEQLFTLGARTSKPLIVAVQGAAMGGGTGIVANCHIVIADPGATFGLTEIRLGLWPFLVFRAVSMALGERRSVEMALTGRIVSAGEAHTLGLVHELAPDPLARAMEIAETVANYSPTAIHNGLSFVEEVRGMGWEQAGTVARRIRDWVFATPDFQEGLHAFLEKRPPRWPSLSSD